MVVEDCYAFFVPKVTFLLFQFLLYNHHVPLNFKHVFSYSIYVVWDRCYVFILSMKPFHFSIVAQSVQEHTWFSCHFHNHLLSICVSVVLLIDTFKKFYRGFKAINKKANKKAINLYSVDLNGKKWGNFIALNRHFIRYRIEI